ncbi:MAG: hypothetical protein GX043_12670 [Desulfovibrionales bacterium]|nr:hypothetical protein [Desulfovibrionales bacterium]
MDQINHYSVATLRLTTVSKNTSIKLKASHFRIGFGKTPIIAAANDFIFTGVDIKSGRLTFGVDTDFNRHLDHPHPQIYYQDISIPFFHKAVQIVLELHKKIPFIYCIGWDVAIGVDGAIWIIEFNAVGNGVFLHQLFDGPVFQSLHWEKVATKELQAPIFL